MSNCFEEVKQKLPKERFEIADSRFQIGVAASFPLNLETRILNEDSNDRENAVTL